MIRRFFRLYVFNNHRYRKGYRQGMMNANMDKAPDFDPDWFYGYVDGVADRKRIWPSDYED